MAVNMSRQMYSSPFVVEGSSDRGAGNCIREVEDSYDCYNGRGGCKEAGNDILEMLPADPFGMDISTTFTAITGWLEDLDYNGYGSNEVGSSKGEYTLFAGFNFIWNSSVWFDSLPVDFGVDGGSFINGRLGGETAEQGSSSSACCDSLAADCSVDDILHKLPDDDVFHQTQDDQSVSGACGDGHYDPDQAFFLALNYLSVRDLLATEGVCRSLSSYIKTDPLLWKNIHIDQPLNEKINDDILIELSSRAQGNLHSLSLVECSRITDDGLKHVLESNPRLTKLSVSGCTRLGIDRIVDNLKAFSSTNTLGLECLRIGGVYGVTQKHYDELKSLLGNGNNLQQNPQKPHFYGRDTYYLPFDDDSPIDIEACPICQNLRLVYDCPNLNCQGSEASQTCRACMFCIRRCIQCGQCINDCVYHENFCLEYLCIDCWNQLPMLYQSVSSDMPTDA